MRIQRLQLENYRGFKSLDLHFSEHVTVLLGENGAGKTAILDAIVAALGPPTTYGLKTNDLRAGTIGGAVSLEIDTGEIHLRFEAHHQAGISVNFAPDRSVEVALAVDFRLYYPADRRAHDLTPGSTQGTSWSRVTAREQWENASASYKSFFRWFREMEDLENEQIRYEGGSLHPHLEAVRGAVTRLLPEFSGLRVRRQMLPYSTTPVLSLKKGDTELPFDALSEGERTLILLVADIARRFALWSGDAPAPLDLEAVVLIDEIDQHLHPTWQREILPRLRKVFPNTQLVVTTHSPQVIANVRREDIRLLEYGALVEDPPHTYGRDASAILSELMGVPTYPGFTEQRLRQIAELIDQEQLEAATAALDELAEMLGEQDAAVVRNRTLIELLGAE